MAPVEIWFLKLVSDALISSLVSDANYNKAIEKKKTSYI